jgi:PQQ-dependent catabolism-associated CXXCW motif protein
MLLDRLGLAAALIGLVLAAVAVRAAEPEPAGYRGEPYRAPVPDTLQSAVVIGDETARALWWSGRVAFVDVLPRPERPEGLPEGTLWRDAPHPSIPGALWLPNTGYADLADQTMDYFEAGLAAASGGALDAPLVFFCKRDCWMSWNAAKRAIAAGYTRVYWYPQGAEGWADSGWELKETQPFGQ